MKKKGLIAYLCLFMIMFSCYSLYSQQVVEKFPESASVRSQLVDRWFTQDIELVRQQSAERIENSMEDAFLIRAEEENGVMEIIVAPSVMKVFDVADFSQFENESIEAKSQVSLETWPKEGLGSWILYRDVLSGKPLKIRHYIMNDNEVFLELYPNQHKTVARLSIFGGLVANKIAIPSTFEYYYDLPLHSIVSISRHLPWQMVQVDKKVYTDTKYMIQSIRNSLASYNEKTIANATEADLIFLKWIIDGIVTPLVGGKLHEDQLRQATVDYDFSIPSKNTSYKSYDYIRNLAAASISADTGISYTYGNSNADVSIEPFSIFVMPDGTEKRVNLSNGDYHSKQLQALLYVLTATEPQLFYLGAIREKNQLDSTNQHDAYRYDQAVAFFPWFNEKGEFMVSIFQNGKEYTFEQFIQKYGDCFVHLVRIKSSMNFFPERLD